MRLGFKSLKGETVEGVTIQVIEEVNDPHIDFKIVGNKGKVKIGVDVLQKSGGVGVLASLKRLIDYKKFKLTRGCLVRSKQIGVGAIQARKCLDELLNKLGGEWVGLRKEDIKPLLALLFVYKCQDYELNDEQIVNFIKQNKLAINNPLIREILSDPSGEEPDDLTDDELPMTTPKDITEYINKTSNNSGEESESLTDHESPILISKKVENVTQNINKGLGNITKSINKNIHKSIEEIAEEIDNLPFTK